ncbi:MAG: DUF222 domain-containing protein [Micropruina sp.]|nr:DUF222 domain-containing protein [Micropruina sp.]
MNQSPLELPVLAAVLAGESWRVTDEALLTEALARLDEVSRVQAELLVLLAEVERREAAVRVFSMDAWVWLTGSNRVFARAAKGLVASAVGLVARPVVQSALLGGLVSVEQAAVIVNGLKTVEPDLDAESVGRVAETLVGFAADFGPTPLRRLVSYAVEVVAPEVAEAADWRSVERAEREAQRSRFLEVKRDVEGVVWVRGKLPSAVGEQLQLVISALATKSRAADALVGVETTWGQACADGLATMLDVLPGRGGAGDRAGSAPGVMVTVDYDTLVSGVGGRAVGAFGGAGDRQGGAQVGV